MSAKIYSAFETVKVPRFSFGMEQSVEDYHKANEDYIQKLRDRLAEYGYKGKNAGEVIKFQVADGYAQYMVISMRPLQLMHIPIIDAYEFQYVHLMTAKEVNEKVEAEKRLKELFK